MMRSSKCGRITSRSVLLAIESFRVARDDCIGEEGAVFAVVVSECAKKNVTAQLVNDSLVVDRWWLLLLCHGVMVFRIHRRWQVWCRSSGEL